MPSPLRDWVQGARKDSVSESSDLLGNEASTPIPTSTPLPSTSPTEVAASAPATCPPCPQERVRIAHQPTPLYTPGLARGPDHPRAASVTPRTSSPLLRHNGANSPNWARRLDPRSLSPRQHTDVRRRLSNASLLRSRSVAALGGDDGAGKMDRSRALALMAVCTLSVGSHFLMYVSGPIKSKLHRELGSTNAQFSLMISALNLNSTWTPLVAGILVARYGTAASSLITTSFITLGAIILYTGVASGTIAMMAFGYFLFGLGSTPLMVVQETLLARLSPGGHLGLSLALGLVSGKTSSFIASFVSLPLAQAFGDTAPFTVGLILCLISFSANILRLGFRCGEAQTRDTHEVSPKRIVKWEGVSRLGDVFWLYILLNIFCGAIWQPFLHLSANIVEVRFNLSAAQASMNASVLLAGAILLYPVVGYITDRVGPDTPRTTFQLFITTSLLTLFCYVYLALPVGLTGTPWPGLISWALGHGASTLLLVVMIARMIPVGLVPLGLGLHKALETAASTASQTLAGVWLDFAKERKGEAGAAEGLLVIYAVVNVIQLALALWLWYLEHERRLAAAHIPHAVASEYEQLPMDESDADASDDDLDSDTEDERRDEVDEARIGDGPRQQAALRRAVTKLFEDGPCSGLARDDAERARGRVSFYISLGFIGAVWGLWVFTAWRKL